MIVHSLLMNRLEKKKFDAFHKGIMYPHILLPPVHLFFLPTFSQVHSKRMYAFNNYIHTQTHTRIDFLWIYDTFITEIHIHYMEYRRHCKSITNTSKDFLLIHSKECRMRIKEEKRIKYTNKHKYEFLNAYTEREGKRKKR